MSNSLCVIIDPQNDFISADGAYAKRHAGITQILQAANNIQRFLDAPDRVRTLGESEESDEVNDIEGDVLAPNLDKVTKVVVYAEYKENQFRPGLSICIPGTVGCRVGLRLSPGTKTFAKTDHSCFTSKDFVKFLQEQQIDTLILCGFLAEYCVRQTALDALASGYKVSVVSACIGTGDDVQHARMETLELLKHGGVKILL